MSLSPEDRQAIEAVIEKKVNGDVRAVSVKVDTVALALSAHIEQHERDAQEFKDRIEALSVKLEPVISGLAALSVIRRFVLWVAAPLGILWGAWQTARTWLLPPHV